MANTTNYNWETPDDTDLVKDGALAIRTLGSSVDTTTKALNPSTTLGDIEYRSSTANTNTRLAIGSTGNVLTVAGGVPTWAAPAPTTPTFVGCVIRPDSGQGISNATATAILCQTEEIDTSGFHSTSVNTARMTIPAGLAGKYMFSVRGAFQSNATGSRVIYVYKNGVEAAAFALKTGQTGTFFIAGLTHVCTAAVNDYFEMYMYQDSGGSLNTETGTGTVFQFSATYLGV